MERKLFGINGISGNALPPVKIGSYHYAVMEGSLTEIHNEPIVNERYTDSGAIDRQVLLTGKDRFEFTITVPLSYEQYNENTPSPTTWGTRASIHAVAATYPTYDFTYFWDVTTNWDFSGPAPYQVYVTLGEEVPHNNDAGIWDIVVALWGQET